MDILNGSTLIEALTVAGYYLKSNSKRIDDLNVFPVPDGDTGSNMSSTYISGLKNLKKLGENPTISDVMKAFSDGLLYGARGNSGVILSQFFAGINSHASGIETTTPEEVKKALQIGRTFAYKAVLVPVEGTILTVINDAAVAIADKHFDTFSELTSVYRRAVQVSLENTPNLLPVLKEAGVVDSGAAGLVEIINGIFAYYAGERHSIDEVAEVKGTQSKGIVDYMEYDFYALNTYGYCTEFILRLDPNSNFEKEAFISKFEDFGNSIVVVQNGEIVKAHIHTKHPGEVFNFAQKYGALCAVKAENMAIQTEENSSLAAGKVKKELTESEATTREPYAIISVVNGAGLKEVFTGLGTKYIIEGGQTMNPSTGEFVDAINNVNADDIYIIPNNKNVFLSASQAKALVNDKRVVVIPAKTIPQGYAALMVFDGTQTIDDNMAQIKAKIKTISSGEVTYSTRNTVSSGLEIKKGDFIAILDNQIINSKKKRLDSVKDLLVNMITNETSMLTIFYGEDVAESEIAQLQEYISKSFHVEPSMIPGGQKVYSYIIEAE